MHAGSAGSATFPVLVTSYEIVIADSKHLARYQWKYIIVDEGHRLKNFNCKLLRELRTIPAANKLLLSGECPAVLTFVAANLPARKQRENIVAVLFAGIS